MSDDGLISDPARVDEYASVLRECLSILRARPETKPGPWVRQVTQSRLSADGRRYTVAVERVYSGKPRFFLLKSDLHDSYWYYPLLRERVIGAPVGLKEAVSQPQYMAALTRRRRLSAFGG